MAEGKKPVATVKASFISKTAGMAARSQKADVKVSKAVKETEKKEVEEVKKEAAKAEVKVEEVKKEAVKKAPAKKAAAKKAPAKKAEVKAEEVKAEAVKAEEVKKEAKKPAAKKAPAKKAEAKEIKSEVILQLNGNDYTAERLLQSAKDVWQYDLGRNVEEINSVSIYVKPDECRAYAVINGIDELAFNI